MKNTAIAKATLEFHAGQYFKTQVFRALTRVTDLLVFHGVSLPNLIRSSVLDTEWNLLIRDIPFFREMAIYFTFYNGHRTRFVRLIFFCAEMHPDFLWQAARHKGSFTVLKTAVQWRIKSNLIP